MCVTLQFLANAAVAPLAICIFLTLAATAPPEMRTICFAMFGVYSLVFGGFAGSVRARCRVRRHRRTARHRGRAHPHRSGLRRRAGCCCVLGSRNVRRDITLVIEDVIERYTEGKRRQTGGEIPALQVHNLDFYYGTNQVLFDVNLEVAAGRDGGPARDQRRRQVHPVARRVGPLAPPPGGDPHLRDELHLPRARADHRPGRGPAGGREDDVPRPDGAGQPAHRRPHLAPRPGQGGAAAMDEAMEVFPELAGPDRPAGRDAVGR